MERFITNSVFFFAMMALLLAGCSSQPPASEERAASGLELMSVAVAESVDDPQRSAQARALASQVGEAMREHAAEIDAGRGRWFDLFSDYDKKPEDFETIHTEFRMRRDRLSERLVELSLQLRDVMTPEEWAATHDRIAAALSEQ